MIRLEHEDTELVIEAEGRTRIDGRELRLDATTMRRLVMLVDRDRLAGLGRTVGVGDETSTLVVSDVTLTIRNQGHIDSVPRSVSDVLDVLLGLADVVLGRQSLATWSARLPIPIETDDLVIRFHTFEPRVHDAGDRDRWTSLFADGTCLRFDGASFAVRGRETAKKSVPHADVARIATLVARLDFPRSVSGMFEHDEDRNVTVVVQKPDPETGELVASRWSWSFSNRAPCTARRYRVPFPDPEPAPDPRPACR